MNTVTPGPFRFMTKVACVSKSRHEPASFLFFSSSLVKSERTWLRPEELKQEAEEHFSFCYSHHSVDRATTGSLQMRMSAHVLRFYMPLASWPGASCSHSHREFVFTCPRLWDELCRLPALISSSEHYIGTW